MPDDERTQQLKDLFKLFDKDDSDSIDAKELSTVVRALGLNPSNADLENLMAKFDKDESGSISFAEFESMHSECMQDIDSQEKLKKSFEIFDQDGNGYVSAEELRKTLTSLGEKLTFDEAKEMINEADTDRDGQINYEEFAKLMISEVPDGSGSWAPFMKQADLPEHKLTACDVYDGGRKALLGTQDGWLRNWDLQQDIELGCFKNGSKEVTLCKVIAGRHRCSQGLIFNKKAINDMNPAWPEGWRNKLQQKGLLRPVTSEPLRQKGARHYCWLLPDEDLRPGEAHPPTRLRGKHQQFPPTGGSHGGFLYLFEHAEDDCFFAVDPKAQSDLAGKDFPDALGPFGISEFMRSPDASSEEAAPLPKTWSDGSNVLGLELNFEDSSYEMKRRSTQMQLLERFGVETSGKMSPLAELTVTNPQDREQLKIPAEATHFVWAFQFETFDDKIKADQKRKLAWDTDDICFASLGGFVYLSNVRKDEESGRTSAKILAVNAIRLNCTRAVACSAHGFTLSELETHDRLAAATETVLEVPPPDVLFCEVLPAADRCLIAVRGGAHQGMLIMVDMNQAMQLYKEDVDAINEEWAQWSNECARKRKNDEPVPKTSSQKCFEAKEHTWGAVLSSSCHVYWDTAWSGLRAVSCGGSELHVWDLSNFETGKAALVPGETIAQELSVEATETLSLESSNASSKDGMVLRGHDGSVVSCAVFACGQQCLSWSKDGSLRIWNLTTGECMKSLGEDTAGHNEPVRDCALFADATQAVSCSEDGTLRVWDLVAQDCATYGGQDIIMTASQTSSWRNDQDETLCSCLVLSDERVLSASDRGSLHIWDLVKGTLVWSLSSHPEAPQQEMNGLEQTYSTLNRASTVPKAGQTDVNCIRIGSTRALSWSANCIRIWDLGAHERKRQVETSELTVMCVPIDNGRRVLSCSTQHMAMSTSITEEGEWAYEKTWKVHDDALFIQCCAVFEDGVQAVCCSTGGDISIWYLDTGTLTKRFSLPAKTKIVSCDVGTYDQRRRLLLCTEDDLYVWDIDDRAEGDVMGDPKRLKTLSFKDRDKPTLDVKHGKLTFCKFFSEGARVVSCSDHSKNNIFVWEVDSLDMTPTEEAAKVRASGEILVGHGKPVQSCVVSSDNTKIMSCSNDDTIALWECEGDTPWKQTKQLIGDEKGDGISFFAATTFFDGIDSHGVRIPDARALSVAVDGTLRVWDLETEEELKHLRGFTGNRQPSSLTPKTAAIYTDGMRVFLTDRVPTPDDAPSVYTIDVVDMSRVESDAVCAWSVWQHRQLNTARGWRELLEDTVSKQPHILYEADEDVDGLTLVHRLAKKSEGPQIIKALQKRLAEDTSGSALAAALVKRLGQFSEASECLLARVAKANVHAALVDSNDDTFSLRELPPSLPRSESPLHLAATKQHQQTAELLLNDYHQFVNALAVISNNALPPKMLSERHLVKLFGTFPEPTARFLEQLDLLRVALPPHLQNKYPPDEGDMLVQAASTVSVLDPSSGCSCWDGILYELWRSFLDGWMREDKSVDEMRLRHKALDEIKKREQQLIQGQPLADEKHEKGPGDHWCHLELRRLESYEHARSKFAKDRTWGAAARAGIIPLVPVGEERGSRASDHLNFSALLDAAVEYERESGNSDVFKGVVLQSIVQHKWESVCQQMFTAMFTAYLVYIIVFTSVILVFSADDGEGFECSVFWLDCDRPVVQDGAWVGLWLAAFYTLVLLKREFHQVRVSLKSGDGWQGYLSDKWNWFDIACELSMLYALFLTAQSEIQQSLESGSSSGSWSSSIDIPRAQPYRAVAGLAGWMKLMYFLRGFDTTGWLVDMLFQIFKDMKSFIIILAIILIACVLVPCISNPACSYEFGIAGSRSRSFSFCRRALRERRSSHSSNRTP
eukprot:COSAG04_NODE_361_length_15860_cov_18.114904_10_plen_1886_part_00